MIFEGEDGGTFAFSCVCFFSVTFQREIKTLTVNVHIASYRRSFDDVVDEISNAQHLRNVELTGDQICLGRSRISHTE